MQAAPHPIRQTTGVIDWLIANREGLMIGVIVAAALVAAMLLARAVGARLVATEEDAGRFGWRSVIGRVLAKTSILFMIIAAVDIVANYAQPPERAQRLIDIAFTIALALQAAVWMRELILALIARKVGDGATDTTLGNATTIIRVLVSVALFALAIVVILDNIGVNVTALIAGLGIGGIAIGLAAQGIFSDLFAALAILFDKPFRRGDTVRYGTTTATVERIGLKTTRMRALTGEQVIMANTKLLEQELHNLDDGKVRRTSILFSLVYATAPEVLERLPAIVEEAIRPVRGCRLIRCLVRSFGASGFDCELTYDDSTNDPDILARHKSDILIALSHIFRREAIAFAYPTQTTFTAAPDGTLVMPYAPPSTSAPAKG